MSTQFIAPPLGNIGNLASPQSSSAGAAASGLSHTAMLAFAGIGVIFFLVGLALLYFGSRMQFVLMELVATRTIGVRPAWRKYGSRIWPWIGLKLGSFLAVFAVVGSLAAPPLIHIFRSMPSDNMQPPGAAFFGTFFLVFATIFFAVFLITLAAWTLRDFVLPFLVLEDATIGIALREAAELIRNGPGSVSFYFVMKIAFALAAGMVSQLCIFLALLVVGIPACLIGSIFWFALHRTGAIGHMAMYIGLGLLGFICLFALLLVFICVIGATLIFYQSYALYFLGGRITRLGNLLEPPPPPRMDWLSTS